MFATASQARREAEQANRRRSTAAVAVLMSANKHVHNDCRRKTCMRTYVD